MIPALGRQRKEDLCESEASLIYRASFRTARATQRNPCLKTKQQTNKQKHDPELQSQTEVLRSSNSGQSTLLSTVLQRSFEMGMGVRGR